MDNSNGEELKALHENGTWDLVPQDPNANVLGCKWVFKTKLKSDGTLERLKARVVAKGFSQVLGLDFIETFSPVIKPTTIRVVLTIALANNWDIRQLNVKNAFLRGNLSEPIYMEKLHGFQDPTCPSYVCKLK